MEWSCLTAGISQRDSESQPSHISCMTDNLWFLKDIERERKPRGTPASWWTYISSWWRALRITSVAWQPRGWGSKRGLYSDDGSPSNEMQFMALSLPITVPPIDISSSITVGPPRGSFGRRGAIPTCKCITIGETTPFSNARGGTIWGLTLVWHRRFMVAFVGRTTQWTPWWPSLAQLPRLPNWTSTVSSESWTPGNFFRTHARTAPAGIVWPTFGAWHCSPVRKCNYNKL